MQIGMKDWTQKSDFTYQVIPSNVKETYAELQGNLEQLSDKFLKSKFAILSYGFGMR